MFSSVRRSYLLHLIYHPAFFDQVRRELITITIEKPRGIENASHLLFVALHLERIGDHACNIASRIVYMVTGENRKFE